MAVVMEMLWKEVNLDNYNEAREKVHWEDQVPEGAIFHVAWHDDEGLHAVDVWESEDAWNKFVEHRLMPVVKGDMGLPGEPKVKLSKAHRVFDALHKHAHS